jgi:hypothetical protein
LIAINGGIWRPCKGLHNFLQDGPIRFQFEPLARIPRSVLRHATAAVAYFAHNKETYQSQKDEDSEANKNRDGYVETAFSFVAIPRRKSRRGVKIVARPISWNVALDELTVLQKREFPSKQKYIEM